MDQYYTNQSLIEQTGKKVLSRLTSNKIYIVDFSAGDGRLGDFLIKQGLDEAQLLEYDIDPKNNRVKKQDWLELKKLPDYVKQFILVFNPPFGKGAFTACKFIEHTLSITNIETKIIAAYLILPLYPIVFLNIIEHNVTLVPYNSFYLESPDNIYNAPATFHEVITRNGAFLDFRMYTALPNKNYHSDIRELLPFVAQDTRYGKFVSVKHLLPIALVRKTGHYAGLTGIVIENNTATLYSYQNQELRTETKAFMPNFKPEERPWVNGSDRWRLTSFMDDIQGKGLRTGCASLKVLPSSEHTFIDTEYLHKMIKLFIEYVASNKDAVRGGGKGPKSIGIGTFNWIMAFGIDSS